MISSTTTQLLIIKKVLFIGVIKFSCVQKKCRHIVSTLLVFFYGATLAPKSEHSSSLREIDFIPSL